MGLDLFTPEVMDSVVKVLPPVGSFFKDTFFKNEKNEVSRKIRVDFSKGMRRIAPFGGINKPTKIAEKIGYVSDEFIAPLVKVKDVTTIADLLVREMGEMVHSGINPDERAIHLLADTMMDFNEQIARREELMCVQAMMDGVIEVEYDGVEQNVDLGCNNRSTVSTLWTNAGATPYKDLQAAALSCSKEGFHKPDICVMERSAYNAFLWAAKKDEEFKQQSDLYHTMDIKPTYVNENVTFAGRLKDPDMEVYIYDEWVCNPKTKVTAPIMPKGKILLASTKAKYSMYYGPIMFADEETKRIRSVIGKRAADSWVEKDPVAQMLTLASSPLPIPHEIDSWHVMTVSATE